MATKKFDRKIVFSDGREFYGFSFGSKSEVVRELVFDTGMVGYQEILSDPALIDRAVLFTYPLIGNYGLTEEDYETKKPYLGGIIVRSYNDIPSNFRYTKTLGEVMEEYNIPGIEGVDTREITEIIRTEGAQKVLFTSSETPKEKAIKLISEWEMSQNPIKDISCTKRWISRTPKHKYDIVILDLGVKYSIIRLLNQRECNVTVVPYNTSSKEILDYLPDGVIISNGPGNPETLSDITTTIKELIGKVPMMGISLGHLLIGQAYGIKSYKMKVGHRGSFPVKDLRTGCIHCAVENHGYSICDIPESSGMIPTHINVMLGDIEGMRCEKDKVMSVQFNPESSPGPEDYNFIFDEFIELIKK